MVDSSKPGINEDVSDDTPFEALTEKSLKTAGYAYLLGDAALFAAGMMKNQHKEAATGLLWGIGGLATARYGNPNAEKQLEILSQRLGKFLQKQDIEIPKNPTTELLTKPHGLWNRAETFLYTYPSQVLNGVYAVGSATLIKSGLQKGNRGDTAAGLLVLAGALAGLFVPEKKIDPEHPPQGAIGKTLAWFQEKPLRISSMFYWANNVGLMRGALEDKWSNPANKGYYFKYLTVASYVFGNLMLAMSSKGHADNKNSGSEAMEKLAETAAQVIAAQPREMREALLQQVAGYLADQPESQMKAADIAQLLHAKLDAVRKPGGLMDWQQRIHHSPVTGLSV